jgi:transcriptional regulator of nitric oxide reductase/ferredoxin
MIVPPFSLGEPVGDDGVWQLLNSGGSEAGYVFETEPLAPLPGFSGAPINVLVMLDLEGRFLDVRLIEHNEPIFVSGLGEAPFRKFFDQYRGLSISSTLVVGVPYGDAASASSLVYLDGVTKATASVRIAHESILAATLAVAREKMQGLSRPAAAFPNPDYEETLNWADLVDQGLAQRKVFSNGFVQNAFQDTRWEDDDPEALADPEAPYLDLWVVDLGPRSIAQAVLAEGSLQELDEFLAISPHDEPILVIDAGRHGLVSDEFVRNTSPDWISAEQDGLPVALRDADLLLELRDAVPDGTAMILRADRRLGFDPTRDWTLNLLAVREHGSLMPEVGSVTLSTVHKTDDRFFVRAETIKPAPPWVEALRNRSGDLIVLGIFLTALVGVLALRTNALAALEAFTPARLAILGFMLVFVGWWGQGQLSIVTVLGTIRTLWDGGSFEFLLYDPFSLLIWIVIIGGFVWWGRGLFCGWLCPFGALQEFAHHAGKRLGLKQIEPSAHWDRRLKWVKYVLLGGLVLSVFLAPGMVDTFAEVEPFKTAITVYFVREWYYVLYAASWLVLGLFLFKGFCRYVCPLGAVMAIGGFLRGRDWIERRAECGSPCQLCKVRCKYGAIEPTGKIQYSECFQCLDCVKIHDDRTQCVPLVLADKKRRAA